MTLVSITLSVGSFTVAFEGNKLRCELNGKSVGAFDTFDAICLGASDLGFSTEDGEALEAAILAAPKYIAVTIQGKKSSHPTFEAAETRVKRSFVAGDADFEFWATDDQRETAIGVEGDPIDADHGSVYNLT